MTKGNTLQQVRDSELRNECIKQEFQIKDLMKSLSEKESVVEGLLRKVQELNEKINNRNWEIRELEQENYNLKEALQLNGFNEDLWAEANEFRRG